MNILEYQMIETLKVLKNEYGVFEIKCELESEGTRLDELMRLKDVTNAVGLPIIIKIGGVEALTDIYHAITIGVKAIIAPMAETGYALSKFINIINNIIPKDNAKDIEFYFNLETITTFNNMREIFNLPNINKLTGVTFGRVDFTGSINKNRDFVDSIEMLDYCTKAFTYSRTKGFMNGLGGAISTSSINFINKLNEEGLIDKFETRKVVYQSDSIKYGEKALLKGIEFELQWLKSKRRYYSGIKNEDDHRITMLEERLK